MFEYRLKDERLKHADDDVGRKLLTIEWILDIFEKLSLDPADFFLYILRKYRIEGPFVNNNIKSVSVFQG